jgi:hypothetical protein
MFGIRSVGKESQFSLQMKENCYENSYTSIFAIHMVQQD